MKLKVLLTKMANRSDGRFANTFHHDMSKLLKSAGWDVINEYPVLYKDIYGDFHNGRIDIYAEKNHTILALELDNASPRRKSELKLMSMPDNIGVGKVYRFVILRRGRFVLPYYAEPLEEE